MCLEGEASANRQAATNSKHSLPVAPNPSGQNFMADKPDLHFRRAIGWAISGRMTAALVCDALTMALESEDAKAGGSQ